jgi:hypothetical protein
VSSGAARVRRVCIPVRTGSAYAGVAVRIAGRCGRARLLSVLAVALGQTLPHTTTHRDCCGLKDGGWTESRGSGCPDFPSVAALHRFHFRCLQSDRIQRGFSSRKAALRRHGLLRVEVKISRQQGMVLSVMYDSRQNRKLKQPSPETSSGMDSGELSRWGLFLPSLQCPN